MAKSDHTPALSFCLDVRKYTLNVNYYSDGYVSIHRLPETWESGRDRSTRLADGCWDGSKITLSKGLNPQDVSKISKSIEDMLTTLSFVPNS